MTLTGEYQYIGRTNGIRAYGREYYYYILLYAKTSDPDASGARTVTVRMRLACTASSTFYGWLTNGSVTVNGQKVITWTADLNPSKAWDGYELTEGGTYYARYTDLGEASAQVTAGSEAKTVSIAASWSRLALSETPPYWLPSTTEAKYAADIQLPGIEQPEPTPDPSPEQSQLSRSPVAMYADGKLVYDCLLEELTLSGLKTTKGVNIGGTAEITMHRDHPAYNAFVYHRTIVTIYRNGMLHFRGRALYPKENYRRTRTVICEGEMCFLRDSINRPYSYDAYPQAIFEALITAHNSAVDSSKRFKIGLVTVTDANGSIALESDKAEKTLDTINKLVKRCGGYITFTGDINNRTINWLADLNSRSDQVIEFGENLLNYSSTGANSTDLATVIIPYGAKDKVTGKRLTIESVNNGKDWIQADTAVAHRGRIEATQTWDDISDPTVLLQKAQEWLDEHKLLITSLSLTALDLSWLNKDISRFAEGDLIRVVSVPHGLDEEFLLTKITENLLNPVDITITLGKDIQTLSASVAA